MKCGHCQRFGEEEICSFCKGTGELVCRFVLPNHLECEEPATCMDADNFNGYCDRHAEKIVDATLVRDQAMVKAATIFPSKPGE